MSQVVSDLVEKVNQLNETIKTLTGKILVTCELTSDENHILKILTPYSNNLVFRHEPYSVRFGNFV